MGGLPWRAASGVLYGYESISHGVLYEYERISHLSSPYSFRMNQVWARGRVKKRHLHAQQSVSFMYNPEAKRRGHVLK